MYVKERRNGDENCANVSLAVPKREQRFLKQGRRNPLNRPLRYRPRELDAHQ